MLESNVLEDHSTTAVSRKYYCVLDKLCFMFGKKNTEHSLKER